MKNARIIAIFIVAALTFCSVLFVGEDTAHCFDFDSKDIDIDPKEKEKILNDIPEVLKRVIKGLIPSLIPPIPALESTQEDVNKKLTNLITQLTLIVSEQAGINLILQSQIDKSGAMTKIVAAESETFSKFESEGDKGVGMVADEIVKLIKQYQDERSLLKKLENLDKDFTDLFFKISDSPRGPWIDDYAGRYAKMNSAMEKRFNDIKNEYFHDLQIDASDLLFQDNKGAYSLLSNVSSMLKTPKGRNQLLQGFNELLTFVGGQFLDMRAMMSEQLAQYLYHVQRLQSARTAYTAVMESDITQWNSSIKKTSGKSSKSYTGMLRYDSKQNKK